MLAKNNILCYYLLEHLEGYHARISKNDLY